MPAGTRRACVPARCDRTRVVRRTYGSNRNSPGLTREAVEQISASKNEPNWMLERRLRAWQIFEALPMPSRQDEEWRRTDIGKLKLDR